MSRLLWLFLISGGMVQAQPLDDPTRPATQADQVATTAQQVQNTPAGMPVVSAIFIGPQQRHAIVGGTPLYEGQQWQGMQLIEIRAGSVIFEHNDSHIEVALRQDKTLKKGKADGF